MCILALLRFLVGTVFKDSLQTTNVCFITIYYTVNNIPPSSYTIAHRKDNIFIHSVPRHGFHGGQKSLMVLCDGDSLVMVVWLVLVSTAKLTCQKGFSKKKLHEINIHALE